MNSATTTYRRLGDFIRQVDVRNRDLKVTNLVGLSIDKVYIPSVANTVGTDLSNYKIIRKNQFACSLMQVSRDKKMPIAVYKGEDAIMSPAYPIFEIIDDNILLPDYLHLWFVRPEFDREVTFYAVGGVRGSLEWEDFCDLQIPVPAIEEQREIVARHKAIEHKIDVNRRLIAKLEETARTIYRHTFVENIDPENLPDGWKMGNLADIISGTLGGDWGKDELAGNYTEQVICLRGADITGARIANIQDAPKRFILKKNLLSRSLQSNDIVIEMSGGTPKQSTGRCVIINDYFLDLSSYPYICSNFCKVIKPNLGYAYYIYAILQDFMNNGIFFKYENSSNGIQNLDFDSLSKEENILLPPVSEIEKFTQIYCSIYNSKMRCGREIFELQLLLKTIL